VPTPLLLPEVSSNLSRSRFLAPAILFSIRLSDFLTGFLQIGSEGRDGSGDEELGREY
jgi:hypothetical protein